MTELVGAQDGLRESDSRQDARQNRRYWPVVAAGLLLFVAWALLSGWMRPVPAIDLEQTRLNVAAAAPAADEQIVQTFRPRHNGLHEIEILLAQSGEAGDGEWLAMRLYDEAGALVAEQQWPATQLQHNQPLLLSFAPQGQSRGQQYRLALAGSAQNSFGAWAYDLDVLAGGAIETADGLQGDLRFVTRYRLSARNAVAALGALLAADGWTLLLGLLLAPLPGSLLLLAAGRRLPPLDPGSWCSLALAAGLALWPLLWLWMSLAGLRWSRGALIAVVALGWLLALALWWKRRRGRGEAGATHGRAEWANLALLALLLAAALGARLLAVRDLAFPPWVDSSRHALITAVMVESGQAPDGYSPFLPVDDFTYHFGFHSLAAMVQMLGNGPLPRTLLVLGQLLNALAALSVYGAARLLTRQRSAALLAAFLVALPFFFPAYYVTWGRLTQLTGALLLAPLLALTWLLARGARGWRRAWWLVGLLAAGLFLIHVRVFLVYLPFVAIAWAAGAARRGGALRATRALGGAGLLGLAAAGPRLWQLAAGAQAGRGYLSASGESYAAFPAGYVTAGWERWFLALGGVAFVMLALGALRGKRRALLGVALGGWAALVGLLLSGRVPGAPVLWLINLNSAYILIFAPLALLLGHGFAFVWPRLQRRAVVGLPAGLLLGVGLGAAALFGLQQQITILNETTILARTADVAGLRWVDEQTPPEARIAVNSWRWLGETWAAGDGGAWIVPLTGREATTPPVDYIGDRELFRQVIAFNEGATAIEDWAAPEAAQWLAQEGVSHLYVGARGGFLDPAALARNPRLSLLYGHDGVFVFEVQK